MEKDDQTAATLSPLKRALLALEKMQARLDALEGAGREPIAIIGMACRMPGGADDPESFWANLRNGVDAVSVVPKDRFDIDRYYDSRPGLPGKTHTRHGYFVSGLQNFDAGFFGMAPLAVRHLDPQQRMVNTVCWSALEDAGIAPPSLEGSLTGVYIGIWGVDYWQRLAQLPLEQQDGSVPRGNSLGFAAGTVSYLLGLKGPSLAVDSACSSSLVSVDLACQALRTGACDLALAGGVNALVGPENFVSLAQHGFLSPDGRCKAFDASADGMGRGEGCGIVVLKRLSHATRDGDRVLAVIRGSAVVQDGRTAGITVPHGPSQEAAIERALAQAGVEPAQVGYVEAHGTGTPLGDPIEVNALANTYGRERSPKDPLRIGSVKTNVGHLESAAGIAGLIKVVLALQHEEIPPSLHFRNPNPEVAWGEIPVEVAAELRPWPRSDKPRYAGVSSFGASGTNAHVVVGEAPERPTVPAVHPERGAHVLTVSARSSEDLVLLARKLAGHLATSPKTPPSDVCYTANTGRAQLPERLALVGRSLAELQAGLGAFAAGGAPAVRSARGRAKAHGRPKLAFLFTGQGSQFAGMARGLYESEPVFRRTLDRCAELLGAQGGRSLVDVIHPPAGAPTPLQETSWTQPALFAVEYAMADLWRSWGVVPSVVLGHSVGEYVAACLAGVFSLEDGLRLVAARGRLMGSLPRDGKMVAVLASEARVAAALAPRAQDVSLAAVNGAESVVISGRSAEVDAVVRDLEAAGVSTHELAVSHAFHSPLMDPILAEFEAVARTVAFAPPALPFVTNLRGEPAGSEVTTPEYWVRQLRQPVRFADGIATLRRMDCHLFLELGPRPVLSDLGARCAPEATFLATLRTGGDDVGEALSAMAALWVRGVSVDFAAFDAGRGRARVALPTYPFGGERYWVDPVPGAPASISTTAGAASRNDDAAGRPTTAVVGEYYNAFRNLTPELQASALEEVTEDYLTFAPLPEILPGYSWILAMVDGKGHPEWARLTLDAQRLLRDAVFRRVDFGRVKKALDFGCGYGSDLCALALKHPHLQGTGYTLSVEQMKVGQAKAKHLGIEDRIRIFNRDSTKDEFPDNYDLAFGFEVAHHVPDKPALFRHIGRHLAERGQLTMADFVSRTGFTIEYDEISSYFPTTEEWVELLSDSGFLMTDAVDISREMAHFFHDPDFDLHVQALEAKFGPSAAVRGLKSYDRLGKMHGEGLALYVLFTAEKRSDLPRAELERINRQVLREPVPYAETSLAHGCYEVEWTEKARGNARPLGGGGRWLLLADEGGLGEALAARLRAKGEGVVCARRGLGFEDLGRGQFSIHPARAQDYDRLLEAAAAAGPLRGVLHLWGVDGAPTDELDLGALREAQQRGSVSLLHLIQALGRREGLDKPRVWIVTEQAQATGREGAVRVAQAPMFGLGKAFLMENPELWGGMVDVEAGPAEARAEAVLAELGGPDDEYHVAWRQGQRLVPRLRRRSAPRRASARLRADATYLVAGGTGGLGLKVARWLVDNGARSVVLTSRRGPNEAARAEIQEMERKGATVAAWSADVTSAADMGAVFQRITRELPPLRGVVNASGLAHGSVLAEETEERFLTVLDVKVSGSFNLHLLTRGLPLDFFVSFSSASALLPSPGQASYAAANAFQDALGHHRVRSGLPGLSVNWGNWGEVGLAATMPEASRRLFRDRGLGEIELKEGLPVLGDLIAEGHAQAAVMPVNWAKFAPAISRGTVPPYLERLVARPEPSSRAEPARGVRERLSEAPPAGQREILAVYLQDRVATVLGYSEAVRVDRERTLLELGFDSLMAVQLRNAIRTSLEVDVPISRLVDSTSIEGLAELLKEKLAVSAGGQVVDVI